MNQVAIKEASSTRFPMGCFIVFGGLHLRRMCSQRVKDPMVIKGLPFMA